MQAPDSSAGFKEMAGPAYLQGFEKVFWDCHCSIDFRKGLYRILWRFWNLWEFGLCWAIAGFIWFLIDQAKLLVHVRGITSGDGVFCAVAQRSKPPAARSCDPQCGDELWAYVYTEALCPWGRSLSHNALKFAGLGLAVGASRSGRS